MQRRLAAIMAGDVVGYSRMMAEDEAGTYLELRSCLDEVVGPAIERFHGCLFKENGDGFFATFSSVHGALEAAAAIQRGFEGRRFRLRIGLNVGDVIDDAGDTYGDGVNVAARLEAMAEPGGILVSEAVRRSAEKGAVRSFRRIGHRRAKNIPGGIEVYEFLGRAAPERRPRWLSALPISAGRALLAAGCVAALGIASTAATGRLGSAEDWLTSLSIASADPADGRPSVAVMPFSNLSGDPAQTYFSDGLTEDLITELSRNPDLSVVARNSTFALRDRTLDARRVGRTLNARYIIEGSARRMGEQLRVTAQLIDAQTGTHIWARNYDRRLADVFQVQAELTAEIVASLASFVQRAEAASVSDRPTDDLRAYDLVLRARGVAGHGSTDPRELGQARGLLRQALELDPDYAEAHAYLGLNLIAGRVTSATPADDVRDGLDEARRAIRSRPDLALGYRVLSIGLSVERDFPAGLQAAERAVSLNPNDPESLAVLAKVQLRLGSYDAAARNAARARALHPMAPNYYALVEGQALYAGDRFDEAAEVLSGCMIEGEHRRNCLRIAVAVDMRRGRTDAAQETMSRLLVAEPDFTIEKEQATERFGVPTVMRRYIDDLAGSRPRTAALAPRSPT